VHRLLEDVEVVLLKVLQVKLGLDDRQKSPEGFCWQCSLKLLCAKHTFPRISCDFKHNIEQSTSDSMVLLTGLAVYAIPEIPDCHIVLLGNFPGQVQSIGPKVVRNALYVITDADGSPRLCCDFFDLFQQLQRQQY